jgi:hypothetical protein
MPFLSSKATAAVAGGATGGGYLNPSKIQSGSSVRFALLDDQPLEFFEVWGESPDGALKPFRFVEDPSPDDIEAELGDFNRRQNREGTGFEPAKFAIAVPVYNYTTGSVQVLQLSQKSLIRELDSISQQEDYQNLLEWDFSMSREGSGLSTEYKLLPLPRKKGADAAIQEAWSAAQASGFDLKQLLVGGNPFGK